MVKVHWKSAKRSFTYSKMFILFTVYLLEKQSTMVVCYSSQSHRLHPKSHISLLVAII